MLAIGTVPGRCARRVRELLERDGFSPWLDPDCPEGVYLCWAGETFFVQVDEADPGFLMLCLGFPLEAEERRDELALRRKAAAAQHGAKVVKVVLGSEIQYVTFQAELFLDGEPTRALVVRCLRELQAAADEFFGEVREEAPRAMA